ncbi:hypothetical protein [Marinobacter salarius]|uniref:hypothetical protein n=1 Tax=Marinobacter salarius TaxID=1420917 RepID=UPI0032EC1412
MTNTNDTWEPQSNWEEHPVYTAHQWKAAVNNVDTRLGYHDYVQHCLDADNSDNQLVLRAAPRWAWTIIEELLGDVSNDTKLDRDGDFYIEGKDAAPNQIQALREAYSAILRAYERADDEPISRRQIQTLMQRETT